MENNTDNFADLFESIDEKPLRHHKPGEKITARVAGISGENVFLDVGGKSEGVLLASELLDDAGNVRVHPGDTLDVYFLQMQNGEQLYTTTLGSGASAAHLEEAWRSQIPVEGYVAGEIKGGFEITLSGNIRGFCPYSQMGLRRVEDPAATYVDKHMAFRITTFEEGGRNLVLSARAILEEEREKLKEELKNSLSEGDTVAATITSIREFGAFADIGGVDGLIPVSEIGWSRVENIAEHFTIGQQVNVVIKSLDWEKDRISLSYKETLTDPWDEVATHFPVGSTHTAPISRLAQFGAFVTLAEGIDGLVHISKMGSGRRINHPREVVEAGQDIEVIIEEINREEKRISLTPSDYQAPEAKENEERQVYRKYVSEKQETTSTIGSLGALLQAKLEEKKNR